MTFAATLMALCCAAPDNKVESGPKADAKIPALKATFASGKYETQEIDIAGERKNDPTIYLFINNEKFDRPTGKLIRTIDSSLESMDEKMHAYAIWVGGDANVHRERLSRIHQSLKFEKTDLGWPSDAKLEEWNISPDAILTIVVAKDGKVAKTFGWKTIQEGDYRKILQDLK